MINLINQSGQINPSLIQFPTSTANISVFGTQSSGKSTLMNHAFSTNFQVLNSKQQRKRCTRGVWLQNNGKFNLIDTEGFDSAERSNEERIFQRQIALFCLAISDVIIINVWMNQIGRYHGSQTHILKAIINSANYLLQSQTKTLLFVIKDCSKDANHQVLKQQLHNTMRKILLELSTNTNQPKSLKFNFQFFFMSHYTKHPQQYEKQAKRLSSVIKIKKSTLNSYEPRDRVVYIKNIWEKIKANQGEIDLRLEEEALKIFVVNRVRAEVKDKIASQITQEIRVGKRNSYERFYQYYIKRSFEQIRTQIPKYLDEKTIKDQFYLIEQQLQYQIQKHFSQIIIPAEQDYLLQTLKKQLQKSLSSIQLQKLIIQQRNKVLQTYKLLVQGHKESQILIKRFSQRITEETVAYERQVSHLFNIFQTRLESQINQELDRQVKKLQFQGNKITDKFKGLCKQFQYNQWQVNVKDIWEKVSHRVLNYRLMQMIEDTLSQHQYSIFAGDKQATIISQHKKLQKRVQIFIKSLLQYFQQKDIQPQYLQKSKQKIRQCLQKSLVYQRKRLRISMLMIGILLLFCYGQYMAVLKLLGFKKRARKNFSWLYIICVGIMIGGSLVKKILQANRNHQDLK